MEVVRFKKRAYTFQLAGKERSKKVCRVTLFFGFFQSLTP